MNRADKGEWTHNEHHHIVQVGFLEWFDGVYDLVICHNTHTVIIDLNTKADIRYSQVVPSKVFCPSSPEFEIWIKSTTIMANASF